MDELETIAALATAPGRGGVAIVRVSGPSAFAIASVLTGRTLSVRDAGRFFHATFRFNETVLDDGLVLVFAGPHSYTGEDVVEFQGHGGSVAPRRVLEACLAAGARLARRGEFTQRAFLNGHLDLSQAEAVIDLVDAKTERAASEAVRRLSGEASQVLDGLYDQAIDLSSRLEHALDVSEDELPPDFADNLIAATADLQRQLEVRLATAREGRLLREGALVVLAGEPNAGKSSLMNALLGTARAIVSEQAGTTRDSIEEGLEIDGWPVRLVDTAGLRKTSDTIEAEGVDRAEDLISKADLVLRLSPAGDLADKGESHDGVAAQREIWVLSKCDLIPQPLASLPFGYDCAVSVRTGAGLAELKGLIASQLARFAATRSEEAGADVTTRQKEYLERGRVALIQAREALECPDWVLAANAFRMAAEELGQLLGKVYSDDLLDALFSRFCVGK